ncbi:MAG: metallophosphoesterase [Planctomycetaceae bacterium]|jgi:3',5'-cyclic AMP phosphodiesterase CpdA|nr:metallophosphoesterase [Planctomycetaceae bacterium]
MPFTLLPVQRRQSRRSFLKTVFTGAVVGSVPAGVWANPAPSEDVWAFISDTHIPADRKRIAGKEPICPAEHFIKIRTDILSGESGKPNGAVVCGDCVFNSGLPEDYKTFFDELLPFRKAEMPVHFVMGNHDNRKTFLETLAGISGKTVPEQIPNRLHTVIETPKANFFLLDSLEKTNQTPGTFGEEQRQWLADELDSRKDKPTLIFAHHYPDFTGQIVKNPHALRDTKEFFDIIKPREQVKAYIFGHSHVWRIYKNSGIHQVNIPATAWRFDSLQPYAWVLATLTDNSMNLKLRSIDPEHPKHNETVQLVWR